MKTRNQFGFSAVEAIIIVVVVAIIGAAGYMMFKRNTAKDATPTATTSSVSEPVAPEVKSTSDLTAAQKALDDADVNAASTDSSQLDTQLNSF